MDPLACIVGCRGQPYDAALVELSREWSTVDLATLPVGAPNLVEHRKVAVLFRGGGIDEYLHEHPQVPIAATRAEVGVIFLIERQDDQTARVYPTGAKDFGTMFHFTAIAIPERTIVGRWDRYEAPPTDTPMIRGKGYQAPAGSGTTINEGLGHDEIIEDAELLVGGKAPVGRPRPATP